MQTGVPVIRQEAMEKIIILEVLGHSSDTDKRGHKCKSVFRFCFNVTGTNVAEGKT